jgi:UDP-N-acetylglucosamine--N-acetylmuramyl-(pentapeptide) pyrophosphoryl-undecaprenol N-acetylglucosamine transferase
MKSNNKRIIISGGGTGGHIFPALAIADALKKLNPELEILFVGALGRMEMDKVPKAGYKIMGLPVMGFPRKPSLKMLKFFVSLIKSLRLARKIISDFNPEVVVGVGGYASGPVLRVASRKKIPCLIQEQNSFPGITNRLLAKKVNSICVAYDDMERFFPSEKIIKTGNPVRNDLINTADKKEEAFKYFNLSPDKPVVLSVGGSLGARTINQSLHSKLQQFIDADVQLIWQTGKSYFTEAQSAAKDFPQIAVHEFVYRMDLAYSIADIVVSRAGASTISELCIIGKPTVFVPSPNVSEDHQTKNAMALINIEAATMVRDIDALENLVPEVLNLLQDYDRRNLFVNNIQKLAVLNSAETIATKVLELAHGLK